MDILKLKEDLDKYFKNLNVEFQNEIIEHEGLKVETLMTHINLKPLDNLHVHLNIVGYENGTGQITFNFGRVKVSSEFLASVLKMNIKSFAFKAAVEFDELRFYNQGFFKDSENFIFNLDMAIQMFLSKNNLNLLKEFTKYLEK